MSPPTSLPTNAGPTPQPANGTKRPQAPQPLHGVVPPKIPIIADSFMVLPPAHHRRTKFNFDINGGDDIVPEPRRVYLSQKEREELDVGVTDYTNWEFFGSLMKITAWATLDSFLWQAVNVLILAVFSLAWTASWIVEPIWRLCDLIGSLLGKVGIKWSSCRMKCADGEHYPLSAVSVSTPAFHITYAEQLSHGGEWKNVVGKISTSSAFDFDLAQFFLQLSALVYENTPVMESVLSKWAEGRDLMWVRFGHEGCCILAVWSVQMNFVVFAFKGTSPFDLSEWLTDCSLRKSVARNSVLPGLIHTGFYTNFGFPDCDLLHKKHLPIESHFSQSLNGGTPLNLEAIIQQQHSFDASSSLSRQRFWEKYFYPIILGIRSQFGATKPDLWITGHSLGAATASVFSSMLLWRRTDAGKASTVPNMNWDEQFNLRGTYTFGTPRTGDTDYHEAIDQVLRTHYEKYTPLGSPKYQFYRIINANDMVCSVPGGFLQNIGNTIRRHKRQHVHKRYFEKLSISPTPREEVEAKPGGVTLTDFQHVGQPIYVSFRTGVLEHRERNMGDMLLTQFWEVPVSIGDLVGNAPTWLGKCMVVGNVLSGGLLGYIKDHAPSEYLLNLQAARKKQKL